MHMVSRRDSSLVGRMVRAAQLDPALYEEVEHDLGATGQATLVVIIAAVAAGIGGLFSEGVLGAIFGAVAAVIGWVVWSLITYWVGKTLFATAETRVTPGEMLRTIGFSHAPGVFNIFRIIPVFGLIVALIVQLWELVAGVIAVRQAMDFSTWRAIGTVIVGWIIQVIITAIFFAIAR